MAFSAAAREADIALLLAAQVHLGTKVRTQLSFHLKTHTYGVFGGAVSSPLKGCFKSQSALEQHVQSNTTAQRRDLVASLLRATAYFIGSFGCRLLRSISSSEDLIQHILVNPPRPQHACYNSLHSHFV